MAYDTLNKIARVLVELNLDKYFDYNIPLSLEKEISVGVHVNVPFGYRVIKGCVISVVEFSDFSGLKDIKSVCSQRPKIPGSLLQLGEWMAEYYCCSKEQAIRALLPGAVRSGKISEKNVNFICLKDDKTALDYLFNKCGKAPARARAIKVLLEQAELAQSQLCKRAHVTGSVINALIDADLITREERKVTRDPFADVTVLPSTEPVLTEEQSQVFKKLLDMLDGREKNNKEFVSLLHGVTGSGKTEIYLRIIAEAIKLDKEAIVLVPEIALTPQTNERFRSRFDDEVSVLHSGLSDGERYDEWNKINNGEVKIVVGARSALFAPFRNIGLIIVDEEHENSYKQDRAPRYNARDVAVMRGYRENAVVILGSATPSLESYYNAMCGKYVLQRLTKRIDDCLLPEMIIVDMRKEVTREGGGLIFSKILAEAIYNRLERGEQTIIFLNRRGFATHLSCIHCGYVANCSECSIDYTYHKGRDCLTCHLCGAILMAPSICPQCKAEDIKYGGVGTEKVETIAKKLFPSARVKRMDSDTMKNRKSYEKILREFRKGEIDILIGTQMIAKGLDFPNVTLVGIVNADLSLHIPDFRAEERTFQLLTQVAGRAGRGNLPGEVYVQTYSPFNIAVQYSLENDYEAFYNGEIDIRKELEYPPASQLLTVRFSGSNEDEVELTAEKFEEQVNDILGKYVIVSPATPAPISKIRNKYRYCLIMRGKINKKMRVLLKKMAFYYNQKKSIDVYLDIDALNLM